MAHLSMCESRRKIKKNNEKQLQVCEEEKRVRNNFSGEMLIVNWEVHKKFQAKECETITGMRGGRERC